MIDMENSASAHLPASPVWLQRGKGFARAAGGVVQGINRFLQRRLSSLEGAMARRAARRELYALGDRLLQDIGLRYDQVDETVDAMFRQSHGEAAVEPAREVAREVATEGSAAAKVSNHRHYRSAA